MGVHDHDPPRPWHAMEHQAPTQGLQKPQSPGLLGSRKKHTLKLWAIVQGLAQRGFESAVCQSNHLFGSPTNVRSVLHAIELYALDGRISQLLRLGEGAP